MKHRVPRTSVESRMSARIRWVPVSTDNRNPSSSSSCTLPDPGTHDPPADDVRRTVQLLEPAELLARQHLTVGHEVQGAGDPLPGLQPGTPIPAELRP